MGASRLRTLARVRVAWVFAAILAFGAGAGVRTLVGRDDPPAVTPETGEASPVEGTQTPDAEDPEPSETPDVAGDGDDDGSNRGSNHGSGDDDEDEGDD